LDASPILNVSTMPVRRSYSANETVEFLASTNYPAFIERSEIRIFAIGDGKSVDKPVAVVRVKTNAKAKWVMPAQADEREYAYV
ncbi:hypothetical protein HBA94_17785, partial [Ochrobactrum sp. GRS2]|nr:hypothetical protein [Ochrobactrum sp. GRS2]